MALQYWLRRQLGFQGVIITDDLEMGAIARRLPVGQAAREALAAGADLLLICNDWQGPGVRSGFWRPMRPWRPGPGKAPPDLRGCGKPCLMSRPAWQRYESILLGRNRNRRPGPTPSLCPEC